MECIYNHKEFCTNDQCPMCGDYCPVPDDEGVCKYEEREEEVYVLTPKECMHCALLNYGVVLSDNDLDKLWEDFSNLMIKFGYVEEGD